MDNYTELKVHYDTWVPGGFGTADDVRITDNFCQITDLKYGKGVQVYAENNEQLMTYALGVYQEFNFLYEFDRIILAISQPRLDHIDEWEISLTALLAWAKDTLEPGAKLALQPNAPLAAGKHCKFCKIRETCKVRSEHALAEVLDDFEDLDHLEGAELLNPATLTNDHMAAILDQLSAIKSWCGDIETRALGELQQGHQVGDWKVVEGRSSRKWTDETTAEAALRGSKLKVAEIFVKKLITAPAAEKLLGKGHPIMKNYVVKPKGKPVLAPGSDKRRPYEITAEEEFGEAE